MSDTIPLWTQDQAIAYEAALEAINDVISGYSEEMDQVRRSVVPNIPRLAWLEMRIDQARDVAEALDVSDSASVNEALRDYSAMVRARDAAEASAKAA